KLFCYGADSDFALSDVEKIAVIEKLLANKGRREKGSGLSAARGLDNSQTFAPPTIEVSSLYYISYLFYGNERFARAIALRNDLDDKVNSQRAIKIAYHSYGRWFSKAKKCGLEALRRENLDPLAGSRVYWY